MALETIKYKKRLVGLAANGVWYEDESSPPDMITLAASAGNLNTSNKIQMFEAYQKVFIANGTNLKVADFGNTKIATAAVGTHPPDRGNVLTGGTSGAKMITDYITSLTGACTIYGYRTTTATFSSGETVTGTDDDGNAISFTTSAAETAPPHWYNWTSYAASTTWGSLPTEATLGCLYRGRCVLSGYGDYPHMWYMSRQGNPWDWNYTALDAQSPVAANDADAGEVGDVVTALIPHKDDYLIIGCTNSTWVLRGDPAVSGSLDAIAPIGIFSGLSWCWDNKYNLYWLSESGLYIMNENLSGITNISLTKLPKLIADWALDPELHQVSLAYDPIRHGINIFKSDISAETNENYWFDLRLQAFMPESYPDQCAAHSAFFYNAEDDAYRGMVIGCKDGYIRRFDDTVKQDELGASEYQAINSKILIGPVLIASDDDREAVLRTLLITAAGGGTGGGQSDIDNVTWEVYVGDTAEDVVEAATLGTSPFDSGEITAPGRKKVYPRARATYIATWAVEKIIGEVKKIAGRTD
jgi:hypothetical protein